MPIELNANILLSIVIPVYNGENTIRDLVNKLSTLKIDGGLEIILVNDGSPDGSGSVCRELIKTATVPITLIDHARNFGEHNAVMSGVRHARGSFIVTMDDDLQNPPEAAVELFNHARRGGWDAVYARYRAKQHKRWRNAGSYFANVVADALLPKPKGLYLSSFRCISAFVASEITKYNGPFPYIDGLVMQVTDRISTLEVEHLPRLKGQSSYTVPRLIDLWLSMATGFSLKPLRITMAAGLAMVLLGIAWIIGGGVLTILGHPVDFKMLVLLGAFLLIGGAQLIFLGVVGEYVGRTLLSAGGKPQAVVRSVEVSGFGTQP